MGAPFSDPLADGPVIQEASERALKGRLPLGDILALAKRVRSKSQIPLCLMGYYNPIFSFGRERFIREAREAGVDGVIIPDLPRKRTGNWSAWQRPRILRPYSFYPPTSSVERIKYISRLSTGFIYYVSLTGVTGRARGCLLI